MAVYLKRKILQGIFGSIEVNGVWRIRYNTEIYNDTRRVRKEKIHHV